MSTAISTRNRQRSKEWCQRAQQSLIEGVNSPSRGAAVYAPGPVVLERGHGSRVWDIDDNEYIDFMMSFGALIQGHAHPKIVEVVAQTMAKGSHFAAATPAEAEAAERFQKMVQSAKAVRFTNSGSEATMLALRLARAHTGRTKFLKFEGHYHGWYDPYCLNGHSHPANELGPKENPTRFPDSEGIPATTFDDVVLAPWNDLEALETILRRDGRELAAIITEPIMANMGCILPRDGYLQKVCDLAHQYGALFILDEVVTGFRYAPGGCQQFYDLKPDLSTFGKALGAGFPVGAVAGPRMILDRMRWGSGMVLHYGTFNGHRLTMQVIATNLDLLAANGGAAYKHIYAVGDGAIAGLRDIFRRRKMQAIVQGFGPMFQIYFTDRAAIHDYRNYCQNVDTVKYSRFVHGLLDRGIYMTPSNGLHWIISTAHTMNDVETLLRAVDEVCGELA
ncbi:MAG: aspartate aminotransferase family protein [Acidobacteria bacterium]|jgi:glutamate-1-semialdehyde 2,1-aminomutase|nr:MAG: aspartate aminotransferase family protein [Acidobacteriota bacterium]